MSLSDAATHSFHLTGRPASARHRLLRTRDYEAFLGALRACLNRGPIEVIAYSLLPDAWHLVVHSRGMASPVEFGEWVSETHAKVQERRFSERASLSNDATPEVAALRNGHALVSSCVAVERLAVSAGYVKRAQDWPWGSAADRFRQLGRLPLASSAFLSSRAWIDYLNDAETSVLNPLSGDVAKHPRRLAERGQVGQHRRRLVRPADQNQTHTHVERAEHLRLRNSAGLL